ncbi:MAG: dihydrofolate reductase family protein [Solirubrobacteraceae bacterium]
MVREDADRARVLTQTPSGGSSSPSGADIAAGGAELAGHAIGARLVDECHLSVCPIAVGGGKRACQTTSPRNSNWTAPRSVDTL